MHKGHRGWEKNNRGQEKGDAGLPGSFSFNPKIWKAVLPPDFLHRGTSIILGLTSVGETGAALRS